MQINGTLRNARRVQPGEDPRAPCLSGEVYGDTKGRFIDGERITTSTIVSEEGDVFKTRYSAYRVESWEGHPTEDAFMVLGMGAQPVPVKEWVAANDNVAMPDVDWRRHAADTGFDDLVTTTFAPLEELPTKVLPNGDLLVWKEPLASMPHGGYSVPDDVAEAIVNLLQDGKTYHEFISPENSSLAAFFREAGGQVDAIPQAKRTYSGMTAAQAAVYEQRITAQRHGNFMQTYTGRKFWPMDPRANEVCIRDIAHSLSLQCRYAGHCRRFYSVAEHSVHIARWLVGVAPEAALWGLLHDASEAYLIDVPRPVKPALVGYKAAEAKVMAAVCQRFGLPLEMPAAVHEADERIIADELVNLVPMDWHARHDDPLGVTLRYWSPEEAEEEFLETFKALTGARA